MDHLSSKILIVKYMVFDKKNPKLILDALDPIVKKFRIDSSKFDNYDLSSILLIAKHLQLIDLVKEIDQAITKRKKTEKESVLESEMPFNEDNLLRISLKLL
jgi:hypothetical protein